MKFSFASLALVLLAGSSSGQAVQDKLSPIIDTGHHSGALAGVFFTPDGKQVVSAGCDRTVRFWDVDDGGLLKTLYLPQGPGSEGEPRTAALTPDGKLLAVAGLGYTVKGKRDFSVLLIDLAKERVHARLQGPTGPVRNLDFSADGHRLAAADDAASYVWELNGAKPPYRFVRSKGLRNNQVRLSPDGNLVLLTSQSGFTVQEVDTAKVRFGFNRPKDFVHSVAWSRDDKVIATGHEDGLRLWSPAGKLIRHLDQFRWTGASKEDLAFSPDAAKLVLSPAPGQDAQLLDLNTFQASPLTRYYWDSAVFSPDGKTVFCETIYKNNRVPMLLTSTTGEIIHEFRGRLAKSPSVSAWSKDGKKVGWQAKRGASSFDLSQLTFGPAFVQADSQGPKFESAGQTLVVSKGGQLSMVMKDGVALVSLPEPMKGNAPEKGAGHYTFLNEDQLVYGTRFGELVFFDIPKKQVAGRVAVHEQYGQFNVGIAPSPDGRYVLSVGGPHRGEQCVWDPRQDRPLLFLRIFNMPQPKKNPDGDWLVWTPEGFYACTPNAEKYFGFLQTRDVNQLPHFIPASQFRKALYRPDVIQRLVEFGSVEKALEAADKARTQKTSFKEASQLVLPTIGLSSAVANPVLPQPRTSLTVRIEKPGSRPVQTLQLLMDGRPYQGDKSRIEYADQEVQWFVDVPPGLHRFSVLAYTDLFFARSKELQLTYQGPANAALEPVLYVLSIGIDDYPKDWQLHCAVNDAIGIEKIFREKSQKTYRFVHPRLLKNSEATRQGIIDGLGWLKSMRAQDVAVIFFAGHGVKHKNGAFHLLTADTDFRAAEKSGISNEDLKKRLTEIPGRILVMLDACHSGASRLDELAHDLSDEHDCGVVVMCAAMGREAAREDRKLGHGYFALALIEGLSGKADVSRRDGQIYLHHLENYVIERVQELSDDEQHPVTGKATTTRSFALARP